MLLVVGVLMVWRLLLHTVARLLLEVLLLGLVSALRVVAPIALLLWLPCADKLGARVAFPLHPTLTMVVVVVRCVPDAAEPLLRQSGDGLAPSHKCKKRG